MRNPLRAISHIGSDAIIAREEGELGCSRDYFARAVHLLQSLRQPIPIPLRVNLATVNMNLGAFGETLIEFEGILSDAADGVATSASVRASVSINISVCQREIGDVANVCY